MAMLWLLRKPLHKQETGAESQARGFTPKDKRPQSMSARFVIKRVPVEVKDFF